MDSLAPGHYSEELLSHMEHRFADFAEYICSLENDNDRINQVYEKLVKYNLLQDAFQADSKDNSLRTLLQLHSQYYRSGRIHDALRTSTMVVMVVGTQERLAVAYATRSEILFMLELYKESIEDIDRAFACGYPDFGRAPLLARRSAAVNLLETRTRIKPYENPPEIEIDQTNPLKKYPSFVEVVRNGGQKCVLTTKDIQVGEVIAVESPVTATATQQSYFLCCHHCLALCYNPIPCDACTETLYCSEKCKRDCRTFHDLECEIVHSLNRLIIDEFSEMIPWKVFFRPEERIKVLEVIKDSDIDCSPDILFDMIVVGSVIYGLIKNRTSAFLGERDERDFKTFIIRYLLFCRQFLTTVSEIAYFKTPDNRSDLKTEALARGIYPLSSAIRRSCCPNVFAVYCGTTVVLTAIRSIKEGTECFRYDGCHYSLQGLEMRRKFFKCECRACEENWPQLDLIQADQKLSFLYLTKEYVYEVRNYNVERILDFLRESVQTVKRMEDKEPSVALSQETQKLIFYYAALGNKRLFR